MQSIRLGFLQLRLRATAFKKFKNLDKISLEKFLVPQAFRKAFIMFKATGFYTFDNSGVRVEERLVCSGDSLSAAIIEVSDNLSKLSRELLGFSTKAIVSGDVLTI